MITTTFIILIIVALCGPVLTALQLPGNWLMAAALVAYAWATGFEAFGWGAIIAVLCIAAAGEALEMLLSMWFASRAGASRRAGWMGLIGGFVGLIALAGVFSLPLPVVGTVFGAILGSVTGCFAGAVVGEIWARGDGNLNHATRVGIASAVGRVGGCAAKIAAALMIDFVIVFKLIAERVTA